MVTMRPFFLAILGVLLVPAAATAPAFAGMLLAPGPQWSPEDNPYDDPDVLLEAILEALSDSPKEEIPPSPESMFGPTNVFGVSGNGTLSIGVSWEGEITVLRWPTTSQFDQLDYRTTHFWSPRMGAEENHGAFAGIFYWTVDGTGFTWFRDPEWDHVLTYLSEDVSILTAHFMRPDLGLSVVQTDFVRLGADLLVRHWDVSRDPSSPVLGGVLVFFENLSPCTDRIPYAPVLDWVFDYRNDFALLSVTGEDALLHFRPHDPDESAIAPYIGAHPADIDALAARLETLFPVDPDYPDPPVYSAIGGETASVGHQCGIDGRTAGDRIDAFADAADGELSGSNIAIGQATGALAWPLEFTDDQIASTTVFLSMAGSPGEAMALLRDARDAGYWALLAECRSGWEQWISRAALPDTDDPQIVATAKRTLQSLRIIFHPQSGCMPATITTQPPYYVDWPRDGAFFNHALDLAGYHEMVTAHNLFYARMQRPVTGSYEMNYYPDGMPGGPLFLEIDQEGIINWEMWEHAGFLEEPERTAYLEGVYPAMAKTADFLVFWRDPFSKLPFWSFQMDMFIPNMGLPGAIAAIAGLEATVAAGLEMGEDPERLEDWIRRADEIRDAIHEKFWDDEQCSFGGGFGGAYMLWPGGMLEHGDPLLDSHAEWLWENIEDHFSKQIPWGSYAQMPLASLGFYWRDRPEKAGQLQWASTVFMTELPTPGTRHYGEGYFMVETEEGKVYENHVAIPHVGAASQNLIAAMHVFGIAEPRGDDDDSAPDGDSDDEDDQGCGCRQ